MCLINGIIMSAELKDIKRRIAILEKKFMIKDDQIRREVKKLKKAGKSEQKIAEILNISKSRVHRLLSIT